MRWTFLAIAILAAAGCVRLGFWQLSRLEERRAENALIERRMAEAPLGPEAVRGPARDAYRQVTATGTYDAARPVIEVLRVAGGLPGVYVVHALQLEDGRGLLVERGWVRAADGRSVDSAEIAPPAGEVTVSGLVLPERGGRPPDSAGWPAYVRMADPAALADRMPYPLLPVVLRRTAAGGPDSLRAIDPPALSEGSHLSYAVQWFAFATIALVGTTVFLRRAGRPTAGPGPQSEGTGRDY